VGYVEVVCGVEDDVEDDVEVAWLTLGWWVVVGTVKGMWVMSKSWSEIR
jgi:hypothetical protein